MDLETARQITKTYVDRMRVAYRQPVFDEWAILGVTAGTGGVLAYTGPRAEQFRANVPNDAELLSRGTKGKPLHDGDIEFVSDAHGTQYDALMKTGATSYLVLNHTTKTLADIRADVKWLAVQSILFELSERFRADPLEL
ncbi:hypothetical protein [Opitutus sp. ER46]|uniref:hypothetical protein n=1 Tax=Opitutus sp. ER46 TaxID=2161864 RepID=UPI000D31006D|nr:hypothetical protein [Opitutus sp. ER46]PTX91756.1 hypothetical protein DB354_18010 [Opitutus sp. ER46]